MMLIPLPQVCWNEYRHDDLVIPRGAGLGANTQATWGITHHRQRFLGHCVQHGHRGELWSLLYGLFSFTGRLAMAGYLGAEAHQSQSVRVRPGELANHRHCYDGWLRGTNWRSVHSEEWHQALQLGVRPIEHQILIMIDDNNIMIDDNNLCSRCSPSCNVVEHRKCLSELLQD